MSWMRPDSWGWPSGCCCVTRVCAQSGAVIGAKIFGLLQRGDRSVALVVLFVAATAFIGGLVTQRFRRPALAAFCALAGAALVLSGLARTFPQALGFFRNPVERGRAWWTDWPGSRWLRPGGRSSAGPPAPRPSTRPLRPDRPRPGEALRRPARRRRIRGHGRACPMSVADAAVPDPGSL